MNQEEANTREYAHLLARRMLGMILRQYRTDAVLTIEDVANELLYSATKISRIENGRVGVSARDARDLAHIYKLSPDITVDLQRLARGTRGRLEPKTKFSLYLASIGISSEVMSYRTHGIPSVLWTSEYGDLTSSEFRENAEELRQILTRPMPPDLLVVVDESALYGLAEVGTGADSEVRSEQLLHVLELSRLPNVTIRVIPDHIETSEKHADITYCILANPRDMAASPGGSLVWQNASTEPELWSVSDQYDYRAITEKALRTVDSSWIIIDAARKLVKL